MIQIPRFFFPELMKFELRTQFFGVFRHLNILMYEIHENAFVELFYKTKKVRDVRSE